MIRKTLLAAVASATVLGTGVTMTACGQGGAGGAGGATSQPHYTHKPDPTKPPASPRTSVDFPRRGLAQPHGKPLVERSGERLLWAGTKPDSSEPIWFNVSKATVDPAKFQFGIGKDRIRTVDHPRFAKVNDPVLKLYGIGDQTDVFGFEYEGIVKAYPIFILDHSEVVNDTFAGVPFAVCW